MTSKDQESIEVKKVECWPSPGCYNLCGLLVTVEDGRISKMRVNPEHPSAGKGCKERLPHFIKWQYHPDQLMYPLKRAGERGENKWERISWDQALDEIADKLKKLNAKYGAESLSVNEGTYRSDLHGIRARLLSLLGNPQNVGDPGTICRTCTFALQYALAGTTSPLLLDFSIAKCAVLCGSNMSESWKSSWQAIKKAQDNGCKLIVIDPRKTEAANSADLWLQIRPGTDAALYLSWLNVIINERLYDKTFVDEWTFGFDQLKQRVSEYPPEKVSEITWIQADTIRQSARMYAENKPAFLMFWTGVAADQAGLNGMRTAQARICLRAITGNMASQGAEPAVGPGPLIGGKFAIRDAMLQLDEKISPEQRSKQLGADRFKLMTWPGYEITSKLYKKVYGISQCMSGHNFLAAQPLIWRAILTEKPYPIKSMITWNSNPLLNAANTKLVYKALKSSNLELHVVLEHFMTPTALLADYVLPAATKFEKPKCSTWQDFAPVIMCGERAIEPMGERRSDYDFFRGIAIRFGFEKFFPWETEEELADYRLKPVGITFKEAATKKYTIFSEDGPWTYDKINPNTGKPTGFATKSGKIELYSNVFKELGYDPLPFYEEPPESPIRTPEVAKDYPLILTTGGRVRPLFHSENRQLGVGMREQHPDPLMDIHPDTASELGIADGDWAYIETRRGVIKQRAKVTTAIHPKVVNVESNWWFPEQPAQEPWLHGVWQSNANVLTLDDPDACDPITGGWAMRALLCKVYKAQTV